MAKRIIIKGADFSENAIKGKEYWFTNFCEVWEKRGLNMLTLFNQSSRYWAYSDNVQAKMRNKPINSIRIVPYGYTNLSIYIVNKLTDEITSPPVASATFENGTEPIVVKLNNSLTLKDNEILVFDNGAYDVTNEAFDEQNFYRKVGSTDANLYDMGLTLILVDFGYIET